MKNNSNSEALRRMGIDVRSYAQCCRDASRQPDPRDLYRGLWHEGELTALYADTNVGKSILAVQIGVEVARKGIRTLYVDLEMTDKGIEKRSRRDDGTIYDFPDNLVRLTLDASRLLENAPEDIAIDMDDNGFWVLDMIECAARQTDCTAIIIDNITSLCSGIETGDTAVKLVNRLLKMRNENHWSILFLAHTPKLDKTMPITRDSMAGSKRVISLIDSAFAIGEPFMCDDKSLRYIKQTKVRLDECRYHENNVMVCRIERVDGLLQFVEAGYGREMDLLKMHKGGASAQLSQTDVEILEAFDNGFRICEIVEMLGVTREKVRYVTGKHRPGLSNRP